MFNFLNLLGSVLVEIVRGYNKSLLAFTSLLKYEVLTYAHFKFLQDRLL